TSDVKTDKVLVFINLSYWAPIDSLTSESDLLDKDSGAIFDLDILFNSIVKKFYETMNIVFEQGMIKVANIITDKLTAKEVTAEKVCVGVTCVTEQELKALLDKNGITNNELSNTAPPESEEITVESPNLEPELSSIPELVPESTLTPESTPETTPEPTLESAPEVAPELDLTSSPQASPEPLAGEPVEEE
ncbi:MAG: hypothetical protein HY505_02440, partial [Candidatus Yanofskybacteria bacterium]|nr:hypothetical protein [Candidatus Yanofskybacteria bacterium]